MQEYTYKINNDSPQEKKRFVRGLFDAIVPTYDLLNHVLSFGTDIVWRKNIFRHIQNVKGKAVVDLACGTGDLSLLLDRHGAAVASLDFSLAMLEKGVRKKAIRHFPVAGDAACLPFADNAFAVATIAFGIRNIPDINVFMGEAFRVLAPGGELVILELTRPANPLIRFGYTLYLTRLLPVIGGLLSGHRQAYQYLARTISTFISPENIRKMLLEHGFASTRLIPQCFGVAAIIIARKETP
ncbi:MAG: ubiquinone/menaquinone biosynthesis methyltransferase [Thermodesulfobacteriota bacterium]